MTPAVAALRQQIEDSKTARAAAELAAKRFDHCLPGTGGELWVELLRAARRFVASPPPHDPLPALGVQTRCPLCQQALEPETVERLKSFDAFIAEEAATTAASKSAVARASFEALKSHALSINLDAALSAEIAAFDPALRDHLAKVDPVLAARRESIKQAAFDKGNWANLNPMPGDVGVLIEGRIKQATDEATELEKLSDPKAAAQVRTDLAELDDRAALQQVKASVLAALETLIKKQRLSACVRDLDTRPITEKVKQLQQQIVNEALGTQLKKEFDALQVTDLQVSYRTAGQRGKTVYGLILEKPGQQPVNRILSEGEQRAVALASFLADLTLSGSTAAVVFDDPVSSLDHVRRWNVVTRLVEEAKKRQVIIFTHDLYFLCLLQEETGLQSVPCAIQSLHKTGDGYGVAESCVPFGGAKTSDRVKMLRQQLTEIQRLEKTGWHDAAKKMIRSSYVDLRMSWERGIEEVLLGGAVIRFRKGIETNRLAGVEITDEDISQVNKGMTRCSNFPHDGAAIAQVPTPTVKEFEQDIEALESWRSGINKRADGVKKRRGL